jgi:hypothetical protein
MNYENKYIKYKRKYIQLKNQSGGIVQGRGSYGIVVSDPRIPFKNEKQEDFIFTSDEVSKIFIGKDSRRNMEKEYTLYYNIITKYNNIITPRNYMLPIYYGEIDKTAFGGKSATWFTDINNNNYKSLFSNMLTNNNLYQITFNKGTPIDYDLSDFLIKILPIINCIKINIQNKLYFDDFKLSNLVKHNDRIKIIDFSSLLDLNELSENELIVNIMDSFLFEPFYIINNPIISIILSTKSMLNSKIKNNIKMSYFNKEYYNDFIENHIYYNFLSGIRNTIFIELDVYNINTNSIETIRINNEYLINYFNTLHAYTILNNIELISNKISRLKKENKINKITNINNIISELEEEQEEEYEKYNKYIKTIIVYTDCLFFKLYDIENNLGKRYKLLELSQIYKIGMVFLFELKHYFETEKRYNVKIIEKYLKIISMCCLLFGKIDNGDLFYTNYTIDDIILYISTIS